ncbi:SDR family oxidoreductase [bacterium]|nr:SDR family oxidoreductase [bacterium]
MAQFSGKHIIITGASSGIGRALSTEFVQLGAKVSICARREKKLKETAALSSNPDAVFTFEADVSDEQQCKAFIEQSIDHHGPVDVLINNAGMSMRALFEETEPHVLKQIMDINFWGAVYCTRYALPSILKSKGSIVAISSVSGIKGLPGRTAYSASKFALHGFFESLRMEYHKSNLQIMIACPGWTNTNIRKHAFKADGNAQNHSPRNEQAMDSAESVSKAIIQGIRDKKHILFTSGLGKTLYWMNKFFPKYVERRIYKEMSLEEGSPIK